MIRKERGFTLIELLVVIAIIGILSTIVIASVSRAREKGADAKTKAQLAGIRTAAEAYFGDNDNTYGAATDDCAAEMFADADLVSYTTLANYPAPGNTTLSCHTDGTTYAVSAGLNAADPNDFWCVDSTGTSKAVADGLGVGEVLCP